MGGYEDDEDGNPGQHRFLGAAEIEQGQEAHARGLSDEFVMEAVGREHAEQGIGAAGNGNGNGEDVINEERRAGDDPHHRREELAGHQVAAAAGGEQLNYLGVAGADDEDRRHGGCGDEQAEVDMAIERFEGFLRAVA